MTRFIPAFEHLFDTLAAVAIVAISLTLAGATAAVGV